MDILYVEERWAVGPHVPQARRIAPGTTLPILQAGSEIIQGSGDILTWTKMAGADPVVEARFETIIGVLVRQYIYAATLNDPRYRVLDILLDGVSPTQARIGRLAWPITRRLMIVGMKARPELLPQLEEKLSAELAWFDKLIAGKRYIVGDELGRADITAASLLAPLARPAALPLTAKRTCLPESRRGSQSGAAGLACNGS
jgi:glutathione S-transferase